MTELPRSSMDVCLLRANEPEIGNMDEGIVLDLRLDLSGLLSFSRLTKEANIRATPKTNSPSRTCGPRETFSCGRSTFFLGAMLLVVEGRFLVWSNEVLSPKLCVRRLKCAKSRFGLAHKLTSLENSTNELSTTNFPLHCSSAFHSNSLSRNSPPKVCVWTDGRVIDCSGLVERMSKKVNMGSYSVGIIGMGDMGRMYAKRISEAGWQ
jgi:hypothetical protein